MIRGSSGFPVPRTALAVILLVAAALRLAMLDREGLWLDELFTARVVSLGSASEVYAELARDVHPPAWFAAMWLFSPDSDAALRLPGALLGIGTVLAATFTATRLAGASAGVLAGLLTATAPSLVLLDREARSNGAMAALSTLLVALTLVPPRRGALLLVPAVILAQLHPFGILAVLAATLYAWLDPEPPSRAWPTVAFAAAGLSLLPWAGMLAGQVSTFIADPWYVPPSSDSLGWVLFGLFDERPGLVVLVLAGLGLTLMNARDDAASRRVLLLSVAFAVALVLLPQVVSYVAAPVLRPRSALPLLPVVLIAAAVGFARQGRVGFAVAGLLIASQLVTSARAVLTEVRMEQWREVAQALPEHARPGDRVIADQRWLWRHYLGEEWALTPPSELDLDGAPGAWLLLGHDLSDPPALAAWTGPSTPVVTMFGAALHRVGPLSRPLRFQVDPGTPGLVDEARLELWGAGAARTRPLRAEGRCGVAIDATEDAAGDEPARLRIRLLDGETPLLDEVIVAGKVRTRGVPVAGAASLTAEISFVNDAVVDGKDRNVHVKEARLACE